MWNAANSAYSIVTCHQAEKLAAVVYHFNKLPVCHNDLFAVEFLL